MARTLINSQTGQIRVEDNMVLVAEMLGVMDGSIMTTGST